MMIVIFNMDLGAKNAPNVAEKSDKIGQACDRACLDTVVIGPNLALVILGGILAIVSGRASAQGSVNPQGQIPQARTLPTLKIEARREPLPARRPEPVEGTLIYSGKKVSVTELGETPVIVNNNLRQALILTPGLLLSEVSNQSFASISYRGLGEPHESWNTLILKDGIPVSPDMYSYPAAYFTPPMESIGRLEFIRGGASLLYGPLPGGTLNYVTRMPELDKSLKLRSTTLGGSYGLFSTYNVVQGYTNRVAYLIDFYRAQMDGLRYANSDMARTGGSLSMFVDPTKRSRWTFRIDIFNGRFGEPGGLTRERYNQDRRQVSTLHDRFEVDRIVNAIRFEHDVDARTKFEMTAWGGYFERFSRRQAASSFGVATPEANVSINQSQRFFTLGAQARALHTYRAWGDDQTLSAGLQIFGNNAPVRVNKGASARDSDGLLGPMSRAARRTLVAAAFAEHKFSFGKLSVTPGLRLELVSQRVKETLDVAVGSATGGPPGSPIGDLGAKQSTAPVVLPGLGMVYELGALAQPYGNFTRGYKPKIFNDGIAFQSGVSAADSFDPTYTYSAEVGVRGQPMDWLNYDMSVFYILFNNQVGFLGTDTGGANRINVGRMENKGVDLALELDAFGLVGLPPAYGRLAWVANMSLLDAKFTRGAADGKRPQYAPPYIVRTGLMYRNHATKASLFGTFVGDHNGSDNNHPLFDIPAYQVWDLTVELPIYKRNIYWVGGVNNLFDANYFARVRPGGGGGIDPALGRNIYLGLTGQI